MLPVVPEIEILKKHTYANALYKLQIPKQSFYQQL